MQGTEEPQRVRRNHVLLLISRVHRGTLHALRYARSFSVDITVVVPQFIPQHWIYNGLHMNTAVFLRKALLIRRDIVIMEVPYHLSKH